MARSISQANAARNNTNSGDSYADSNVSMKALKDWYNARFFRQAADSTPSTGNANITNPVSLNADLNNKSWLSLQLGAASESYHRYQENGDGRFRVAIYANSDVSPKFKVKLGGTTYGDGTKGTGSWLLVDNINVYTSKEAGAGVAGAAGKEYAVELLISWNGGSTYSSISGLTVKISFGNQNCQWKKGGGDFVSIGGKDASLSSGHWDHLTYN